VQERTAVVVDHHPVWLKAIQHVLRAASVDVVATTTSLREASDLVESFQPELAVVELATREDETRGVSWLSAITKRFPELKVIVLSSSDHPAEIEAAFAAGANVYVVKKARPDDLAVAVRQAYDRSLYLRRGQEAIRPPGPCSTAEDFGLTPRELEILRLVAEGLSNRLVAKRLWVTEQTVKFHLSNIYAKLGVSNRTAAGRVAQMHGLLLPTHGE
jgi:DNA-binding NarL/FixJ family response regulator